MAPLLVRVQAPPLDDRANTAVCRLVAKALGVPQRDVTVVRGERSRQKVLRIEGFEEHDLRVLLASRPG